MFGNSKSAAAAYSSLDLEGRVNTADPHGLVQMLYEGAIVAVGQAEMLLAAGDIPGKGKATTRAIRIIDEGLRASLDLTQGGKLATQLQDLYSYMSYRLLMANLKNDVQGFQEVRKLLTDLKGAWAKIKPAAPRPALAAVK